MAVVLFALPLLGDITLGTALGVVGAAAELFLAKGPKNPAPKAMTSCWGDTIPITYNSFRVPGKVIQAGELMQVDVKVGPGKKTNNYSLSFGVLICEGIVSLGRIWADNQVIYDPRPNALPATWQASTLYGAGDQVLAPGVTDWIFTATVNGESGPSPPSWNFISDGATRDNEEVWLATKYRPRNKVGKQYNFYFQFYPGDEAQMPDSTLEAQVGVGNQPAYRGTAYCVFDSFDLTRYGNRIPNFEFEVFGERRSNFVSGAEFYGGVFHSSPINPPFLLTDGGNIFDVAGFGSTSLYDNTINIKTLAISTLSAARSAADATSFGCPAPYLPGGGFGGPTPIGGKYFFTSGWQIISSTMFYTVVLYELNDDGSATALGCKSYGVPLVSSSFVYQTLAVTIRTDTQEVMFAYNDIGSLALHMMVLARIVDMEGPWFFFANENRTAHPTELSGDYAGAIAMYHSGYPITFVGDVLWITLNKACMDYFNANPPPATWSNPYYYSLLPTWAGGVMLKVISASTGVGDLSAIFEGPVNFDFGWPFLDEGLKSNGSPGNTYLAAPRDCWSPPIQQQIAPSGAVQGVFFTRAYSDVPNVLSVVEYAGGTDTGGWSVLQSVSEAPFTVSLAYTPDYPEAVFIGDSIYGLFGSGGQLDYVKLGAFVPVEITLADICQDVSLRCGLVSSQLDYSGLVSVIPTGVALLTRDTGRAFIESIMPAYFFDIADIGAKLVGTLRSNSAVVDTITEDLLASAPGDSLTRGTVVDRLSSMRSNDLEIPKDMSITYYDFQHDYQQGSQQARRGKVTNYSSGKNTVSVPCVMTPYEANNAAQRGLFLLWTERAQRKMVLPPEKLQRTAVDVVNVIRDGRTYTVRLTKVTLKANLTIEAESVSEDLGNYHITGTFPITSTASGSFSEGTINPATQPVLVVADTATLRPDDLALPGVYVAAANSDGGGYTTVAVQESPDDSVFTTVASLPDEAAIGSAVNALAAPAHYAVWDSVSTVTVSLLFGTLANADKWALTANLTTNLMWFSTGEIIQFATATLNGDGSYTLSGLRRGRLGTEQFVGAHAPGETVLMLTQAVMGNVTYGAPDINATRYWQALNDAPDNPASAVQTLTMTTRRLLPYAPTYIRGSRDMPGNLTITGLRRVRWHGQPLWHPAETDTPVTVEIDIYSGMSVVRTLTGTLSANGSGITDPLGFTAYYAEADQVLDFGSPQASVSYRAYSRNATIGRGYALAGAA
jgi:hypothetical protein